MPEHLPFAPRELFRAAGRNQLLGLPPATSTARTYASFSDAIAEVALARIAAGIHFRFSREVATQMGADVANFVSATQMIRLHGERDDD